MEQTKENLKHDYNKAVESYNELDYSSFFRNIRPAIENLSQFLIFDVWNNEMDAMEIINGDATISKSNTDNNFHFSPYPAKYKPTGRIFPELFAKVFYCKYPDVYSSKVDESKKRLKRGIDSCCAELGRYYSIASELGSHAGRTNLDVEIQARGCAAFMMGFIDFIKSKSVISPTAIQFVDSLPLFSFAESINKDIFEAELNRLIKDTQEKELALLTAQKLQNEAELREQNAKQRMNELEAEIQKYEDEIRILRGEIVSPSNSMYIESDTIISNKDDDSMSVSLIKNLCWDISVEKMDDDQLDLIENANDESMLIAGCAGSGKSIIAMHKAKQLFMAGYDVILIAYTKSLNRFMQNGTSRSNFKFFYYHQWKKMNKPTADYIIVDEIQDFTKEEIQEFIDAAKKHFLFFGDTAQSIYRPYGKNTMSIEQISQMTGLNTLQLYNNYRLPRSIAKITQTYVGVNVSEYKEKIYQNNETELPHFVFYDSEDDQLIALLKLVNENSFRSIGILLASNSEVLKVCDFFRKNSASFEFKYNSDDEEGKNINILDFRTILPKIMTYHSAKGLQFDLVILPFYHGASDDEARKTLYVAMTRALHSLYVMYSSTIIPSPLNVPPHLYLKE